MVLHVLRASNLSTWMQFTFNMNRDCKQGSRGEGKGNVADSWKKTEGVEKKGLSFKNPNLPRACLFKESSVKQQNKDVDMHRDGQSKSMSCSSEKEQRK